MTGGKERKPHNSPGPNAFPSIIVFGPPPPTPSARFCQSFFELYHHHWLWPHSVYYLPCVLFTSLLMLRWPLMSTSGPVLSSKRPVWQRPFGNRGPLSSVVAGARWLIRILPVSLKSLFRHGPLFDLHGGCTLRV